MRVMALCQIFEFLHFFSEHVKTSLLLVKWCRMRVTALCQIFEFLHLFQRACENRLIISRLVQNASDGFVYLRSLNSCTFFSEHVKTGLLLVTWYRKQVTALCQIFEFLHLFQRACENRFIISRLVQNASDGFVSDL